MNGLIRLGLICVNCVRGFCFRVKAWCTGREQWNGGDLAVTLGEVYDRYVDLHMPGLAPLTAHKKRERFERTIRPLFGVRMAEMSPERITRFLKEAKASAACLPKNGRYGFQKELVDLQQIFSWWSDQFDFRFRNPVRPFHRNVAVISEIPRRERKIALTEMQQFWDELPLLYRDIAMMQFYIGGRIGEAAGIQVKNIDLDRRMIVVREVLTWIKGKPVVRATPKNGEIREVYLTDTMLEIVLRRLVGLPRGCLFLFNDEGRPLRYNRINDNYNRAWQRAGLDKFSGTHQMRYGAAQAALQLVGKREAVGAVTGHKSQQMADKYSLPDNTELNRDSLLRIESHLNKKFGPPPEAGQPRIGSRGASGIARASRVETPSACRSPESEGWG